MEQHYTVAEVADKLRFSKRWVLRAIETGKLRALKLCSPGARKVSERSRIRIPESAVLEMCGESPKKKTRVDQAVIRRELARLGLRPEDCGRVGE